ncbi:MAG: IS91 family transposase [Bacteroidales bacterium]|nr:IS91 family transposase [Bacteroidales bacterium]
MSRTAFDVGQIIRDYGEEFFAGHQCVTQVRKSFGAMAACRTKRLGGHVEQCVDCGEIHVSYNSCRDRHCPKCQHKDREVWIRMRKDEVIPGVKYFHVVFTIPDALHPIAMANMELFFGCMFRSVRDTLDKFFETQGLQGGMTCLLHTWGSNLFYHPHIHCIVTGGGIDADGVWHRLNGCKGARDFLFPVHALSRVFRAKMLASLTRTLKKEELDPIPQDVRKACMKNDWVVYSRPPAKGVDQVLEYVGRYAYRAAISNSRIKYVSPDGMVTYEYKDYRSGGRHKLMRVKAVEFLHLFSLHILPSGFVRIRQYGVMAPSNRWKLSQIIVRAGGWSLPSHRKKISYQRICEEKGWVIGRCPRCGGFMRVTEVIKPERSPPPQDSCPDTLAS